MRVKQTGIWKFDQKLVVSSRGSKKIDLKDEHASATAKSAGDEAGGDTQGGLHHTPQRRDQIRAGSAKIVEVEVEASNMRIDTLYNGQRLPSDDWKCFKSCINPPAAVITLIEDSEKFSIVESKNGLRSWVMYDGVDWKFEPFKNKGELKWCPKTLTTQVDDDFIEDGKLVSVIKRYRMRNGKKEVIFHFRQFLTADRQGNIIWSFTWSLPHEDIKITKVARAQRVFWGKSHENWIDTQLNRCAIAFLVGIMIWMCIVFVWASSCNIYYCLL